MCILKYTIRKFWVCTSLYAVIQFQCVVFFWSEATKLDYSDINLKHTHIILVYRA